jgi:hypothetical protein
MTAQVYVDAKQTRFVSIQAFSDSQTDGKVATTVFLAVNKDFLTAKKAFLTPKKTGEITNKPFFTAKSVSFTT